MSWRGGAKERHLSQKKIDFQMPNTSAKVLTETHRGSVVVFGSSPCPFCKMAKEALEKSGLPVVFVWDAAFSDGMKDEYSFSKQDV